MGQDYRTNQEDKKKSSVRSGKLLLAFGSKVINSEYRGAINHILLPHDPGICTTLEIIGKDSSRLIVP
jgi:hypothetical protein